MAGYITKILPCVMWERVRRRTFLALFSGSARTFCGVWLTVPFPDHYFQWLQFWTFDCSIEERRSGPFGRGWPSNCNTMFRLFLRTNKSLPADLWNTTWNSIKTLGNQKNCYAWLTIATRATTIIIIINRLRQLKHFLRH